MKNEINKLLLKKDKAKIQNLLNGASMIDRNERNSSFPLICLVFKMSLFLLLKNIFYLRRYVRSLMAAKQNLGLKPLKGFSRLPLHHEIH